MDHGTDRWWLDIGIFFGVSLIVSLVLYAVGLSIVTCVAVGGLAGYVATFRLNRPRPGR